jgi:hypothetical protein
MRIRFVASRITVATGLALAALGATAQTAPAAEAHLNCQQLQGELMASVAAAQVAPAAAPAADAQAAAGVQLVGAFAQQAAARSGGGGGLQPAPARPTRPASAARRSHCRRAGSRCRSEGGPEDMEQADRCTGADRTTPDLPSVQRR